MMAEKMKTKPLYERENLIINEFDAEDVITTSGVNPDSTESDSSDLENAYGSYNSFNSFNAPGSWF